MAGVMSDFELARHVRSAFYASGLGKDPECWMTKFNPGPPVSLVYADDRSGVSFEVSAVVDSTSVSFGSPTVVPDLT